MENINPHYTLRSFDNQSDIFAYIDESGTEGFDFSKTSEWFVVSAIAITFLESNKMLQSLRAYRDKYRPGISLSKIQFKKLNHNQRKNLLGMIKDHNYLTSHSAFYKPKIRPSDILCTYPSMYFVGVKNVLERLSWLAHQYNKNKVHILISNRNNIDKDDLGLYLFTKSVKATRNLAYVNKVGNVSLSTPNNHPKLLFADYAASSLYQCLVKRGEAKIVEKIYFDIFLKGKLFSSNHTKYKGVWRNGFKCTPDEDDLVEYDGILEEGSHRL